MVYTGHTYTGHTLQIDRDILRNLWITGHSLGGALASIFMARLQTIVDKDDPLVRGLKQDDQEYFVGSTVLEVMTSQFLKNVSSSSVRSRCPECLFTGQENRKCRRCKIMRMREESGWPYCCLECWQNGQSEEDKAIINILKGCKKCKDKNKNPGLKTLCENCYSDCGECGNCDSCNVGKYSKDCKDIKENTLVILRDCYTFGSPKVGDTEFAETFVRNQRSMQAKSPFKPTYWRVANEYDPGNSTVKQSLCQRLPLLSKCDADTNLLSSMGRE